MKLHSSVLQKELDAGLTAQEIAEKHGMSYRNILRRINNMQKPEGIEVEDCDCFGFNKELGLCTCLKNTHCQGAEMCKFYLPAWKALRRAQRNITKNSIYEKGTQEVIRMIKENQGV